MPATNTIREALEEGSDYIYAPTEPLLYSDGTPVLTAHVDTFTITVTDVVSGTVIRNAVSVFGAGGVLTADGILTVPITAADTAGIGTRRYQERRLTFELLTNAGYHKNWVVLFRIDNFMDV